LVLAFVVAAFAVCPSTSPGDLSTPVEVFLGYRTNYEVAKSGAHGSIYVTLTPANDGQYLYYRAIAQSTTSDGGSLHSKYSINGAGASTDADWDPSAGTLLEDDVMRVLLTNITTTEQHWITFFPSCPTCVKTMDFAIEITLLDSINPDVYSIVELLPQMRTLVFKATTNQWVYFKKTETNSTNVFVSVAMGSSVDSKSEVHQYLKLGALPSTNTSGFDQQYPAVGEISGNYITQAPFALSQAGDWYLVVEVVKQAVPGNDVGWTIKAGFNEVPCASASGLSVSMLSFGLILAFFFKF